MYTSTSGNIFTGNKFSGLLDDTQDLENSDIYLCS